MEKLIKTKNHDLEIFLSALVNAGKRMVDEHYFQTEVAEMGARIYRERVYCYELYHQLRNVLGDRYPYKLDGEMDKAGHPIIQGKQKPDFIVHIPGKMESNLVVMEVKPVTVYESDLESDIDKLMYFINKANYFAGIVLIYGNETKNIPAKLIKTFARKKAKMLDPDNQLLLVWHPGPGRRLEIVC